MECFKCGISDGRALLYEIISLKGVKKICRKCLAEENLPILNKPKSFQIKGIEPKTPTVYERLSKSSGIKLEPRKEPSIELQKKDQELKKISDENYESSAQKKNISLDKFVDNFHWVIMRARRSKKLTQEQLGKELGESEVAIKLAERGIIADGNNSLIEKFEAYLKIKILRENERSIGSFLPAKENLIGEKSVEIVQEQEPLNLSKDIEDSNFKFGAMKVQQIKISDLKSLKQKKEKEILEGPVEPIIEEFSDKDRKKLEDHEEVNIDDLIFGRK